MRSLGLFVLRAVVGLAFAAHGAQKLFGMFGGKGPEATAAGFEQMGLRPGRVHAYAAGGAEFFGGLLLFAGFLTPLDAAALIAVMTAAVITVHASKGFWAGDGGYEYNLTLGAALFALAAAGAGSWSLDNAFGLDLAGAGWGIAALCAGIIGGVGAVIGGSAVRPSRPARPAPRTTSHPHAAAR